MNPKKQRGIDRQSPHLKLINKAYCTKIAYFLRNSQMSYTHKIWPL